MAKKKIHLIGNAHLDPVWLWQWQEGFAEIKATFRSALDRMKEFDDFKFTSACSSYYMWIEKSDKAMFEEIRQRVKEGRWNIVGGWFIQPDCNLPSGEAFARQGLVSQRYFKEKFGVTATVGYNVDSFGHNGNLPKILRNSGMDSYVFMRPMPHEKKNLPQSLFKWESMDGSCVTTYRIPDSYGLTIDRFDSFEKIANMDGDNPMMAFYGVGNHGGGATIEMLEKMHEELDERYIYSTPTEYFKEAKGLELPTVCDDLQFHAKGCYSACSQVKTDNRLSENKLIEAEKFSALSKELMDTPYPAGELTRAWKNVLFNQFHDILCGCSIKEAYTDAAWSYGEALNIASQVSNFALQQISWNIDTNKGMDITAEKRKFLWVNTVTEGLGIPVVVFNPLPFPVERVVQVGYPAAVIKTDDGEALPVQLVRASKSLFNDKYDTAFVAKVPALGYSVYRIHITGDEKFENPFVCTESSIENEKIKLKLNPKTGEVASIILKDSGKELLAEDTKTVFVDETDSDTWAHDIKEFKNVVGVCNEGSVSLIEEGPVRATLRSRMKLFDTEIIRDYTLERGSSRISVKATVDFREKHKMLKFSIPAAVEKPKAYAKIPFGFIERPVDGTEQVCGEWATICDENGGLVLANRDKYSFDADGNVLSMTVLRGAIFADHIDTDKRVLAINAAGGKFAPPTPEEIAYRDEFCEYMEQGIHKFSYSISPFESIAMAEREGQLINAPLTSIIETFHKGTLGTTYSGIEVSKENIVVTALKKWEDGEGWVLRCYETEDKDTEVTISLFGTTWTASFAHSQVKTFIIENDKVTEADFIEWR